jgi:hypothetical protein
MKIWVFLAQRPDETEPVPCMYWGNPDLALARRMVETWPHRISDAQELDVMPAPTVGKTEESK